MSIRADRRQIVAQRDPEGIAAFIAAAGNLRRAQVAFARAAARIDANAAFVYHGCASLGEFAGRHGVSPGAAQMYAHLGRGISVVPVLEEHLLAGVLTAENAALAARILTQPGLVRQGENWIEFAKDLSERELRRRVRHRIAETQQKAPVTTMEFHVTDSAREDFHRAQVVASRKAGRILGENETFFLLVQHYLDAEDDLRAPEGRRRLGPTSERPDDRYVPIEVERLVRRRAGDRCEVPGCTHHVFVDLAHLVPHTSNESGREVSDLALLCTRHHVLYDAGRLVLEGWKDGHPVFRPVDDGDGSSDDDLASQVAESAPVYGRAPAERPGVVKCEPRPAWPEGTSEAPAAWESARDRARDPRPPPQESEAA